ncbi:MAG: hypothetical protein PHU32_05510 [Candidatus ainarchaeum sp.]|jgi:uncharacterized membrane protein|nr:hypothetical protein [Candidatus ainarchaeum sp.]
MNEEKLPNQNQDNSSSNQNQKDSLKDKNQKNTGMAIVAYIIFFIPLLTESKNDPFVKYHVKQGLLIFIGWILISIISWILPWQLGIIVTILNLSVFVLMIIGIMSAAKGEQKPLPIIGKFGEQFKF